MKGRDNLKLFIDFDDTIIETMRTYCRVYNFLYQFNKNYKFADYTKVTQWDFSDVCPLTIEDPNEIFESPLFFNTATLQPNANEILKELNKKYELYIVTIGTPRNIELKARWIGKRLPFIDNLILLYNKEIKMDKSIIDMSGGILIDDHINNLHSSNAQMKVCFNGSGRELPWNKNWKGIMVNTWIELEDVLLT